MTSRAMVRQGDLLFIPLDKLPQGAQLLESEQIEWSEDGGIVLAHGEATGHSHTLEAPDTPVYTVDAPQRLEEPELAIEVLDDDGAIVSHQEHDALELERGLWRVRRQRELDWEDALVSTTSRVVD
jgi:hypothetical protein